MARRVATVSGKRVTSGVGTATLADFLLARIAEDEEVALAATRGPWSVNSPNCAEAIVSGDGATEVVAGGRWGGEASVFESDGDAAHIARHDPARVLAECEAKRRIVECHSLTQLESGKTILGYRTALEDAIRALALPYADHPDYRDEWKP